MLGCNGGRYAAKKIAYSPLTNLLPVESNVPINVCFYYILKCSNGEARPHEGYLRFINLRECTSKTKREISLWRIRIIFFLFVLHLWITMCVSSSTSMSERSNIKEENFNRYFISDSPILNFVVGAISKSTPKLLKIFIQNNIIVHFATYLSLFIWQITI